MSDCRKVLVVDDEPLVLELVEEMLSGPDCRVTTVRSGTDAMEELKRHPYCVLLSDIQMPGMTGLELARCARQEFRDLGIVLMTGYAEEFSIQDAIRAGADECINKPFKSKQLRAVLEQAVVRRSVQHDLMQNNGSADVGS